MGSPCITPKLSPLARRQVAIGDPWCENLLLKRVDKTSALLLALGDQGAFALLRNFSGLFKILYLCWTVPPSLQSQRPVRPRLHFSDKIGGSRRWECHKVCLLLSMLLSMLRLRTWRACRALLPCLAGVLPPGLDAVLFRAEIPEGASFYDEEVSRSEKSLPSMVETQAAFLK